MIFKITKNEKANALITVLAVLFVLSTMAVSFAKVAGNERLAAVNYGEALKARMLSEAGISFAVSKLRRDFQNEVICTVQAFTDKTGEDIGERRWTYTYLNDDNPNDISTADNATRAEDDVAAGVPMEELQRVTDDNPLFTDGANDQLISHHPSYAALNQTTKLPQTLPNTNLVVSQVQKTLANGAIPAYTLKIIDLSSQIDLNSHIPEIGQDIETVHLPSILNNLSVAISQREPYVSIFPEDVGKGPLFSTELDRFLGEDVLFLRESLIGKQFTNKRQILNIEGIDAEKAFYLWDFICAVPQSEQKGAISRPDPFNVSKRTSKLEAYRNDSRSPININLAPFPVLAATFANLKCIDPDRAEDASADIEISYDEAKLLAARICRERRRDRTEDLPEGIAEYPFREWESFKSYMLTVQTGNAIGALDLFTGSDEEKRKKAQLIYAMSDPNTHLRRTNPDSVLYQPINKTDITRPTFELTFYPQGLFEITSLGQIINVKGSIVQNHKRQIVAKIFDLETKTTQEDFRSDHILATLPNVTPSSFEEINSYSSGNNVNTVSVSATEKISIDKMASSFFGHIAPVTFTPTYRNPDPISEDPDTTDRVMFRASFNGNLIPDGSLYAQTLHADVPIPNGLADDNEDKLDNRNFQPPNALTSKSVSLDQLLLPKDSDSGTKSKIGDLATDGVIFREFRDDIQFQSPQENDEEISTLCYKTLNNLPIPSALTDSENNAGSVGFWIKLNKNENWENFRSLFFATSPIDNTKGVQMEIQAKYNNTETDPVFSVQARRKFYDITGTDPNDPNSVPTIEGFGGLIETNSEEDEYGTTIETITYIGGPSGMNLAQDGQQSQFSGIKEHNWYHIVVSWNNVTDITSVRVFGKEEDPDTESNGEIIGSSTTFNDENPFGNTEKPFNSITLDISNTVNDDGLTALEDANFFAETFAPLERSEVDSKQNAVMYFGTVKRTFEGAPFPAVFSTACTIDDILILNHEFPNATVSRFEETGFTDDVDGTEVNITGMFSGKFPNINSNKSVLGVFDFTRRVEDETSGVNPLLQTGQFEEVEPTEEEQASSATEYITFDRKSKKKKKILVSGNLGVDNDAIKELHKFLITENPNVPPALADISLGEFKANFLAEIIEVWNQFQNDTIQIPALIFGTITIEIEALQDLDDTFLFRADIRVRTRVDRHVELANALRNFINDKANELANSENEEEVEEEAIEVVEVAGGALEVLIDNAEISSEELDPPVASKAINPATAAAKGIVIAKPSGEITDILVTPESTDYEYNLLFSQDQTADDSSLKVSFSSPVIDDVTISYQTKLKIYYNVELLD